MANKPGMVVKYNEELPSRKLHDPFIMWSSDFDFFNFICRLTIQTSSHNQLLVTISLN